MMLLEPVSFKEIDQEWILLLKLAFYLNIKNIDGKSFGSLFFRHQGLKNKLKEIPNLEFRTHQLQDSHCVLYIQSQFISPQESCAISLKNIQLVGSPLFIDQMLRRQLN